jgi:hypothetical protein
MKNVVSSWARIKRNLPAILAALEGASSYPLDRLSQLEQELQEVKFAVRKSQSDASARTQ